MAEYFAFWRRYADFKGKTTRRGFWTALLLWGMIDFVLLMTLSITAMFALKLGPGQAQSLAQGISSVYSCASIVPLLAITVRRLRDAGYSTKSFLWLLIPVIGQIAFLARLCSKSK